MHLKALLLIAAAAVLGLFLVLLAIAAIRRRAQTRWRITVPDRR